MYVSLKVYSYCETVTQFTIVEEFCRSTEILTWLQPDLNLTKTCKYCPLKDMTQPLIKYIPFATIGWYTFVASLIIYVDLSLKLWIKTAVSINIVIIIIYIIMIFKGPNYGPCVLIKITLLLEDNSLAVESIVVIAKGKTKDHVLLSECSKGCILILRSIFFTPSHVFPFC